jgi:predicted RNA-binding protein (virulence factor B family)
LQKPGFKATLEIEPQLLVALKENNGFLPITDKTSPDVIYNQFGVSKKKFKIALGGLYKKRLLRVEDDGIYLVAEASAAKSPIPANIAKTKAKK